MSMSARLSLVTTVVQQVRLSTTQMQQLQLYARELEEKIYGPQLVINEFYEPGCPECNTITTLKPDGVRYKCLRCNHEFTDAQAVVVAKYRAHRVGDEIIMELPKYDSATLKDKISMISPFVTPSALFNADRILYINIIHQFSSLNAAFAVTGIAYANPAKESWQTTIIDYVGILTDGMIAKIVGVSRTSIWGYRQRFGIPTAGQNFVKLEIGQASIEEIRDLNNQKLQEAFTDWETTPFRNVRKEAQEVIKEHPNKSYREIVDVLRKQKGIKLSRRTVNKYALEAGLRRT